MKQLTGYGGMHCANCGALMQGEFCHECGQSIHSVLKPVHGMIEETIETVLHIDGRILHTLPPLLLKPGFLTLEYFSGRRVRYIAPFRLMFVLCLLSFFVFHLAIDQISAKVAIGDLTQTTIDNDAVDHASSPAQVRKALQDELQNLQRVRDSGVLPQVVLDKTAIAAGKLQQRANQRLVTLGAAPMPAASLVTPFVNTPLTGRNLATDNPERQAVRKPSQPVHISWLPAVANEHLTELGRQFQNNWETFKDGTPQASAEAKQRMISGVFSVLPPAMFVLMPVFALLLTLFYVFRRRLYMEHLIVALHSHAFIFLSLLLITLAGMLSTWLRPHAAWVGYAVGLIQTLLLLWIPVYLLIMQKRVYRQGWAMTAVKFWFVGWCYFWLVLLALLIAGALGMAH
ncbi:MAG: DUF3667 domain-containing protein [Pseudomonadota bacterium]|nr:DUF3667 domain-containing protein [Pseudomonadota bacterium]